MYTLNLCDGTRLSLDRLKQDTFAIVSKDSSVYHELNDFNLSLAFLDEDDSLCEVYVDYCLQNYYWDNGIVRFKIAPWDEVYKVPNGEKRKQKRGGKG